MRLIDRLCIPLLSSRRAHQSAGAILIVLIIAIALFATLGAAIYTLSNSDSYSNLAGNLSMRAFYTAESGYRYAASESGDISRLENLLIKPNPRTLPGSLGWFSIDARPYFFITDSDADKGDISLSTRIPSNFPPGFSVPATIRLELISKLEKKIVCDATLTALTPTQSVEFQVPLTLEEAVRKNTIACPVATVSGNQHLTEDNNTLVLLADTSSFFPGQNGQIKIGDSPLVFSYTVKQQNSPPGQTTLTNIQGVSSASQKKLEDEFDISDGSDITLKPFIEMAITGYTVDPSTLGEKESPYVGKKEIAYLTPVKVPEPLLSESFEDLDNWKAPSPSGDLNDNVRPNEINPTSWGIHQGGALLGGPGYAPAQVIDLSGKPIQSIFMLLDMIPELEDVWSRNSNFLSYDVQVKHTWGSGMTYVADGICVRWNAPGIPGQYEGLGISFMYYSSTVNDFIPDSIKPPALANTPLIVMWEQKIEAGVEIRNWIAYKNLDLNDYVWNTVSFGELSSLFVRVTEGKDTNGIKKNTLKVFYGDATNSSIKPDRLDTVGNDVPDDRNRWVYPPSWATDSPGILWPDDTVDDWREKNDYMTWVTWDAINPAASDYDLSSDSMSIVTSNFVTPDDDFSNRNEIALHAFGNLNNTILFDDFAVRTVQHGFGIVSQR